MSNKRIGHSAEARYLYNNWLFRYSGTRSYASKGLFDCIFIAKDLTTRLVQLKYSTKKQPRISKEEVFDIKTFIDQNMLKGIPNIWVGYVLWQARQQPIEIKLN